MVAWPLLSGHSKEGGGTVSERTQAYTTSRNLLISTADACERIMSSYKEVGSLSLFPSHSFPLFLLFHFPPPLPPLHPLPPLPPSSSFPSLLFPLPPLTLPSLPLPSLPPSPSSSFLFPPLDHRTGGLHITCE